MMTGIGRFPETRYGFCIVVLCHGCAPDEVRHDSQPKDFFSFVAIEPQNYSHFRKRYTRGEATSFAAFGQELARGWGYMPSDELTDFVARRYSIEFDVEDHFIERLLALVSTHTPKSPFPLKPAIASGS